jgi:hypothetical protein
LDPLSHFRVWMPACIVQFVVPSMVDEYHDGKRRPGSKKTKQLTGTNHKPHDISEDLTLSKTSRSRGPVKTKTPKEPHLKDFYAVKKAGSGSSRQLKATRMTEEISSQGSASNTSRSKIIKALDNLDTVDAKPRFPQQTLLISQPLPVNFDSDSDDLSANDENLNGQRRQRSSKLHSEIGDGSPEKSPRKSTKHTSPRLTSHARAPSPSPLRPHTIISQIRSDDVIEIPSDSEESVALKRKLTVAPLLLAKARAKPKTEKLPPGKGPDDIIDLT